VFCGSFGRWRRRRIEKRVKIRIIIIIIIKRKIIIIN
jgi:hypothetical protein